jgi:hypothetical protein
MNIDPQHAAALAANPATSAEQLAALAVQHRELWPQIAAHPNAYEGLVDWMRQHGFDPAAAPQQVAPAPQQPAYPSAQPTPGYPADGYSGQPGFGQPIQPAGKKKTGWIIGVIAAAVVVALIAVLAIVFWPKGGGSVEALLAALETEDEYGVSVTDYSRIEQAIGEKFPKNGDDDEIEEWFEAVYDDDRILFWSEEPDPFIILGAESGYMANLNSMDSMLTALPGSASDKRIGELLDEEDDDLWYGAGTYVARIDGVLYSSWDEDEIPSRKPDREDSVAADKEIMQVLQRLQKTGAYTYSASRLDGENTLGDEDAAESSVMGSAFSATKDGVVSTRVFAHESSDDAEENLDFIENLFDGLYDDVDYEVKREGSLVVVTLTAKDIDAFGYGL